MDRMQVAEDISAHHLGLAFKDVRHCASRRAHGNRGRRFEEAQGTKPRAVNRAVVIVGDADAYGGAEVTPKPSQSGPRAVGASVCVWCGRPLRIKPGQLFSWRRWTCGRDDCAMAATRAGEARGDNTPD